MGEARRSSVKGLSTARQDLNLIPRKAPSRLTNRLVRTRMLGGVRGRGLAAPSYSIRSASLFGRPFTRSGQSACAFSPRVPSRAKTPRPSHPTDVPPPEFPFRIPFSGPSHHGRKRTRLPRRKDFRGGPQGTSFFLKKHVSRIPSSTATRQTKCLSPLDTKGTRGIWAYFRRVSRCEDGCLESSEEAPALEPQRVALVWLSVRSVDTGRRFLKKNVQA